MDNEYHKRTTKFLRRTIQRLVYRYSAAPQRDANIETRQVKFRKVKNTVLYCTVLSTK